MGFGAIQSEHSLPPSFSLSLSLSLSLPLFLCHGIGEPLVKARALLTVRSASVGLQGITCFEVSDSRLPRTKLFRTECPERNGTMPRLLYMTAPLPRLKHWGPPSRVRPPPLWLPRRIDAAQQALLLSLSLSLSFPSSFCNCDTPEGNSNPTAQPLQ